MWATASWRGNPSASAMWTAHQSARSGTAKPESKTEQAKKDEAKKSALESEYSPLYAVAGLTDALADALKGALTELSGKRPTLERQAKESADELREFVITLPEQFKHLPNATKARIAELQRQANELIAQATSTYGELAGRAEVAKAVGLA